MPISATFAADFTSFATAVDKATAKLKGFETDVSKVDRTISKFGNEFSGTKVIQDALAMEKAIQEVGGTSKLTGKELERAGNLAAEAVDKMKRMGIDVPPQLQKLANSVKPVEQNITLAGKAAGLAKSTFGSMFAAFSAASLVDKAVGSLIRFGTEAFESAGHIADLADATGLSTDAIQEMQSAAALTGTELDTFTKAATKLGINLANGTTATKDAVKDLGLSYGALKAMKPEDQFKAVMEALKDVTNAGERNRLGVALLGKSFIDLGPAAVQGYGAAADAAIKSSEQQIRSLDAAGDAWVKFKEGISKNLTSAMGNIIIFFDKVDKMAEDQGTRTRAFFGKAPLTPSPTWDFPGKGKTPPPAPAPDEEGAADRAKKEADAEKQKAEAIRASNQARAEALAIADKYSGMDQAKAMEKEIAALKGVAGGAKVADEHLMKFHEDSEKAAATLEKMGFNKRAAEVREFANQFPLLANNTSKVIAGLQVTDHALGNQAEAFAAARNVLDATIMSYDKFATMLGKGLPDVKMPEALREPPKSSFFEGLTGGLKSLWGTKEGEGLTGGKGFGGLMSGLGKGLISGFGNILSGGITGAVTMGLSLATKGVTALFNKFTGAEGKKTNDERDAFIKATYGTEDALRKLAFEAGATDAQVRKIFSTKTVDSFKAALGEVQGIIGNFTSEREADAARLTSAIDKYGFAFEELGAVLQKSKLDEQSKELIEDSRVLIEAGIDVATVNTKMAAEVNKFIATAKKTGTEIPSAMKPMLQKMIDQGTLTDEAGNKIQDLQALGVTFSDTMTQGFDRVVKKLDQLIDRLAGPGGVADVISKIPSERRIDIIYDISGDVPQGDGTTIRIPPKNQPQSYAQGTGGRFLDFGSGTPAILHGRERVMTAGESEGSQAVVTAVQSLQAILLRAMRENALQVRDQFQLARA